VLGTLELRYTNQIDLSWLCLRDLRATFSQASRAEARFYHFEKLCVSPPCYILQLYQNIHPRAMTSKSGISSCSFVSAAGSEKTTEGGRSAVAGNKRCYESILSLSSIIKVQV